MSEAVGRTWLAQPIDEHGQSTFRPHPRDAIDKATTSPEYTKTTHDHSRREKVVCFFQSPRTEREGYLQHLPLYKPSYILNVFNRTGWERAPSTSQWHHGMSVSLPRKHQEAHPSSSSIYPPHIPPTVPTRQQQMLSINEHKRTTSRKQTYDIKDYNRREQRWKVVDVSSGTTFAGHLGIRRRPRGSGRAASEQGQYLLVCGGHEKIYPFPSSSCLKPLYDDYHSPTSSQASYDISARPPYRTSTSRKHDTEESL